MKKYVCLIIALGLMSRFAFSNQGPVYNFNFYNDGKKADPSTVLPQPTQQITPPLAPTQVQAESTPQVAEKEKSFTDMWILSLSANKSGLMDPKEEGVDELAVEFGVSKLSLSMPLGSGLFLGAHLAGADLTLQGTYEEDDEEVELSGLGLSLTKEFYLSKRFSIRGGLSYSYLKGTSPTSSDEYALQVVELEVSPTITFGRFMIAGKVNYDEYKMTKELPFKESSMAYGLELGIRI